MQVLRWAWNYGGGYTASIGVPFLWPLFFDGVPAKPFSFGYVHGSIRCPGLTWYTGQAPPDDYRNASAGGQWGLYDASGNFTGYMHMGFFFNADCEISWVPQDGVVPCARNCTVSDMILQVYHEPYPGFVLEHQDSFSFFQCKQPANWPGNFTEDGELNGWDLGTDGNGFYVDAVCPEEGPQP